jgi:phosphonopyruvate decarboxylase
MIIADDFLVACHARNIDFYTGVPCSFLAPLINRTIRASNMDYVAASSEGEAIAIAAGAWLAGRNTAVMCQNSGLGNTVNPLTSLNFPFRIPTLLIVTWRGQPGIHDEPQHELMGQVTARLLDIMRIEHAIFPHESAAIEGALDIAVTEMTAHGRPYALILPHGTIRDDVRPPAPSTLPPVRSATLNLCRNGGRPRRDEILQTVINRAPEAAAIIVTTGKAGRELFTLADRKQHLYLVGSMGCASGVGLGVSLNTPRPIIILDGDGAALMKLGTLATIGATGPDNLIHIVLDNGVYDSTGGQATVSPTVDFAAVALACNYRLAISCDSLGAFDCALARALEADGPTLVHAHVRPGSMDKLGRPTVTPHEVAQRFQSFITSD